MECQLLDKSEKKNLGSCISLNHVQVLELVTVQPPFDTFMLTPSLLVQQMKAFDEDMIPSSNGQRIRLF